MEDCFVSGLLGYSFKTMSSCEVTNNATPGGFKKLSLSHKKKRKNSPVSRDDDEKESKRWNSCLSKPVTSSVYASAEDATSGVDSSTSTNVGKIRVKSIAELEKISAQPNTSSRTQPVISDSFIISSSDDENDEIKYKKTPRNRRINFSEADGCVIISSDDDFKPGKENPSNKSKRKKSTRRNSRRVISKTDEKIISTRKLTKNTNLKTFPRKCLPPDQQLIDKYFKAIASSNKSSYFQTFDESSVAKESCSAANVKPVLSRILRSSVLQRNVIVEKPDEESFEASGSSSRIGIKQFAKIRKQIDFDACIEKSEKLPCIDESSPQILPETTVTSTARKSARKLRKRGPCPSYKVVEGTTFAVDAFRFGDIEGVTHYFLTHYHADHYIGLKKTFSKPIFLSTITAKLVSTFIHTSPEFLQVIDVDDTTTINGIEVTAIDANHCPGALMFLFKFPNGSCTLHTGDFRASTEMEEGHVFWNNSIDTIYLDTTYLSNKYNFKAQSDSISDAISAIDDIREKHIGEKILYVFGSYVIGKEKIWSAIAEQYELKVWTEGPRKKALDAVGNREILKYFVNEPRDAQMHIVPMMNISYDYLLNYLALYNNEFEMLFAIRASGWEKNSKPQYRGKINIVGIEYSEHSSYDELRRFVRYLQPTKIISTVPSGSDVSKTSKIPRSWFNNGVCRTQKGYQQSITNFIHVRDFRRNLPSSSRMIREIDEAKCIDSSEELDMHDATLTIQDTQNTIKIENEIAESVSDWML